MERRLAWQERQLRFAAAPLAEMVAEFNRYNRHQLVVADERLAARRFGGIFRADAFDTLVHLLESNHGVRVERRENATILTLGP
jgi:transmembrane sensor